MKKNLRKQLSIRERRKGQHAKAWSLRGEQYTEKEGEGKEI